MLHLIDPWRYQPDPSLAQALYVLAFPVAKNAWTRFTKMWFAILGAGEMSLSTAYHRSIAVNQFFTRFDRIYVDGDQSYEGATADLEQYRSKVKPGGFVAGDDYARNPNGWMKDSVTRAVDDIIARGLYEEVELCPILTRLIFWKPQVFRSDERDSCRNRIIKRAPLWE